MSSKEHKHHNHAVEQGEKAETVAPESTAQTQVDSEEKKENSTSEQSCEELLEAKDKELARLQEQLKRVTADTENYRKRMDANFERRIDSAKEDIFRKLLPIIDHLEMAIEASRKGGTVESLCQGVELVLKDAVKIMESYEVVPIEAKGQPFDPACHEAVMMEESDELPDETVSNEFKKGYKIGNRVLRPSMVCVARSTK
ncbi:MAG: nucleotide exchange factor GrpE [Candidatus Bruticola sp.]